MNQHYDTIVIGLGSSGVTAATTLVKAGRKVLGLEAQNRIGGRVNTVPFGDGTIELGAEWIHGQKPSRVYDEVVRHNITVIPQPLTMEVFRSDGQNLDLAVMNELVQFCMHIVDHPPDQPESLGSFITKQLLKYLSDNKPELLKDQDFVTEFLSFMNLLTNNYEASNDWTDVSTNSRYEELEGEQNLSWHRYGYKTFFDIMLNKYNNGPGLPNLETQLNKEVVSIVVPQEPSERVIVKCKDGTTYTAETAIVTVSLGVLKATHASLFTPALPADKQTAIDKMSIGVMDKVILSFDKVWWPRNVSFFGFVWKGEEKKSVPKEDYWTTRIYGFSLPMGSSNCITLWTSGDVGKEVETLPEDVVRRKCLELLQRFVGNSLNVTIPQPSGIIRSTWFSNPFTRGSYTYDNMLTPQYPDARTWLGSPLNDSAGKPRVLFAGEATNLRHFSTVHGASETGFREAMRLLPQSKI